MDSDMFQKLHLNRIFTHLEIILKVRIGSCLTKTVVRDCIFKNRSKCNNFKIKETDLG